MIVDFKLDFSISNWKIMVVGDLLLDLSYYLLDLYFDSTVLLKCFLSRLHWISKVETKNLTTRTHKFGLLGATT